MLADQLLLYFRQLTVINWLSGQVDYPLHVLQPLEEVVIFVDFHYAPWATLSIRFTHFQIREPSAEITSMESSAEYGAN